MHLNHRNERCPCCSPAYWPTWAHFAFKSIKYVFLAIEILKWWPFVINKEQEMRRSECMQSVFTTAVSSSNDSVRAFIMGHSAAAFSDEMCWFPLNCVTHLCSQPLAALSFQAAGGVCSCSALWHPKIWEPSHQVTTSAVNKACCNTDVLFWMQELTTD